MRPRLRLLAPVLLAAVLAAATPASASVPSPTQSVVDPHLLLCPYDAIPFVVVVKDIAGNVVMGSTVQLEFTSCLADPTYPGTVPTHLCPTGSGPLTLVSGADGRVQFMIKAGGTCPGSRARVYADGVIIAQRTVASPDQDGSLVVIGQDAAILVAKEMSGSFDATADLDGDGDTNNDTGDYAVYDAHSGHGCDAITPVLPRSWGSVKLLYR
jgi:hypothetical protein